MKLQDIINFVSDYYQTDILQISSKTNSYRRSIYYYLAIKYVPVASYGDIAKPVNRGHATVLHGVKKLYEFLDIYNSVRFELNDIEKKFTEKYPELVTKEFKTVEGMDLTKLKRRHRRALNNLRNTRSSNYWYKNENKRLRKKISYLEYELDEKNNVNE